MLWWPDLLLEIELCGDWGGGAAVCAKKKMYKKEGEMGEGERRVDCQVIN